MDNSKSRVMAEIAAGFREQKIKWQTAAFMRFFTSPERLVAGAEEVQPVMAEEVLPPVEEVVPATVEVEEEVADSPPSPASSTADFVISSEVVTTAMEVAPETEEVPASVSVPV